MVNVSSYLHVWDTHNSVILQALRACKAPGKDWFLAGSSSDTICLDRGSETQPDRVEKAASSMGMRPLGDLIVRHYRGYS